MTEWLERSSLLLKVSSSKPSLSAGSRRKWVPDSLQMWEGGEQEWRPTSVTSLPVQVGFNDH